jgi:hypothetical protein
LFPLFHYSSLSFVHHSSLSFSPSQSPLPPLPRYV